MPTQQQRILAILSDGLRHTTREITERTGIGYPPRRIHELRKKGFVIKGEKGEFWEEYWLELTEEPKTPVIAPQSQIDPSGGKAQTLFNVNLL